MAIRADNMDTDDTPALFVPEGNEDSVDIYEGLDFGSSCNNVVPEKSAPSGLNEAMDLFEEIVTEEQQSKEASYTELKSRFQAAQSQLTDLHRRLEQLQLQNTGLLKENYRLKMNISILLKTAKQEVTRKDAEIQMLNQQCSRGQFPQYRPQRDSSCSSQNQRLPPPPLDPPASTSLQRSSRPRLLPSKEAATPPAPLSAPPAPPAALDPPAWTVLQRSSRPSRLPSKEAATPPAPLSAPPAAMDPPPPPDATSPLPLPPPSGTPRLPNRPPLPPPPAPPLPTTPLREDAKVLISGETQKCIEPDSRNQEQFSCDRLIRRSSREDCRISERLEKHRHHSDKHKDKKYRSDSERKGTTSNSTDRHERRHSHKDRTSNFGDLKSTEKNSKVSTAESDRNKSHGSKDARSRDERRHRTRDKQSRSSDSKELKHHRDSSRSERRLTKDQPSREGRQEWRAEEDGKKHRRDSKEKHRSKERCKKSFKSSERSSKEKTVSEKVVGEENSPHRKLCFMETLNLTLSPVKKPAVDCEGGHKEPDATEAAPQDNVQPNMEDVCALDEVDSRELEATPLNCPDVVDKAVKMKTSDKRKDVEEAVCGISTTCNNELADDISVHSTSAVTAGVQKDDSLPKCVRDQTENHEKMATKTSNSEDALPVNPTEGAESSNTSNNSKATVSVTESVSICLEGKSEAQSESLEVQPKKAVLASPTSTQSRDVSSQEVATKEVDTVSSSISLETLPQEGLSLPEAIDFLTQNNEDGSSTVSAEPTSTACIEVPKVSSTTQETTASDRYAEISKTPKKIFSPTKFLSPPRSNEKGVKPSSSMPLLYDEDSMMRTLSNLKKIPDAISPLRSPVRISKRNLQHLQKPGHVKSLHKEFSSAPADALSKKVDVNKENKHPGSPAKTDGVDRVLAVPLDAELEEGEILSESDEAASPHPPTKRAKLKRPVRSKVSPKCVLKHKTEEKSDKEASDSPDTIPSPPNKSRFKTVCPAATKASFSSIEEVMDTFKLVRYEIRKKYMKLHKTFPKKSFYGVMENFQESFVEFVDGADFGQICNRTKELKSKLKKVIASVFSKVLNNGIVKRIFEQQAVDLKQKLWDFVDVQVDYLFKDAHTALKSVCKPTRSPVKNGNQRESNKHCKPSPVKRKEAQSPRHLSGSEPCAVVPFRTGLGSRGKGIRITLGKSDDMDEQSGSEPSAVVSIVSSTPEKVVSIVSSTPEKVVSIVSSTPEKVNSSLMVAPNATTLDKTDFELLTEQQATSLTFNLVRDSQMGEIFKCLLQGSDLLDSNAAPGDQSAWALSTPRKDGERIITITTPGKFHTPSKLLTPSKFESPSRLITTWSSISPRKASSPSSKLLFNPALFDESCLLEVPSENKIIQRPYSILAEDLAVSLTIPSPLKSDSHLSFLQPPPVQVLSTPDSVLSAHISEDALLDEADATEHDIHLTLDTDNSSCGSSASVGSSHGISSQFVFKPDIPMQALVMERSTDHFIVKIRQASSANTTLTANDSLSQTLIEDIDCEEGPSGVQSNCVQDTNSASIQSPAQGSDNSIQRSPKENLVQKDSRNEQMSGRSNSKTSLKAAPQASTSILDQTDQAAGTKEAPWGSSNGSEIPSSQTSSFHTSSSDRDETVSESERSLTIAEELETTPEKPQTRKHKDRKRRKSQENSRAKRSRMDEDGDQETSCEATGEETLSPNSLSAKNVVRRRGEVVIAWTREEDRAILIELKTKGASRETFSYLSEKLDKPSAQIAQRFHQLMKLFKKMDT